MLAKDSGGGTLGYVLSVTTPNGYGGDIVLTVGFDLGGTVTGMTVTSMSETPALGAKCTEEDWQAQFAGIPLFPVTYVKSGESSDGGIDAISGATTTTKAVVGAVNAAYGFVSDNYLSEESGD